jgi:hypothetical protein
MACRICEENRRKLAEAALAARRGDYARAKEGLKIVRQNMQTQTFRAVGHAFDRIRPTLNGKR